MEVLKATICVTHSKESYYDVNNEQVDVRACELVGSLQVGYSSSGSFFRLHNAIGGTL